MTSEYCVKKNNLRSIKQTVIRCGMCEYWEHALFIKSFLTRLCSCGGRLSEDVLNGCLWSRDCWACSWRRMGRSRTDDVFNNWALNGSSFMLDSSCGMQGSTWAAHLQITTTINVNTPLTSFIIMLLILVLCPYSKLQLHYRGPPSETFSSWIKKVRKIYKVFKS